VDYLREFLTRRIREKLSTSENGLTVSDFRKLKDQLVRQHIVNGLALAPYLAIVEIILDEARQLPPNQYYFSFNHVGEWQNAFTDAKDLITLFPDLFQHTTNNFDCFYHRLSKPAKEVFWLKGQGFESITVKNGDFDIAPKELSALTTSIEHDIRKFGGLNLILRIFLAISKQYDQKQGRYHLGRRCTNTGREIAPQLPVGYLLNLSVKPNNFEGGSNSEADLSMLLRKTVAFGCLYDLQPYSAFELMFQSADTLVKFLREISLYDSLFTIPQLRPADICNMLRGLFDWVDNAQIQKVCGWTFEQAIEVIDAILRLSPPQKTVFFREQFLAQEIANVPSSTVKTILDAFTHHAPSPNKDFRMTQDIECLDFPFKPLLYSGQNYCFLDASWCGGFFYEAIANVLRSIIGSAVDEKIGLAAEKFLKSELTRRGVKYISGKYNHLEQSGECDFVIETTDAIIFIELKKKALTRKARAGSDVYLLLDISSSLIDSQIQLGKHELMIRKLGFLDIEDLSKKTHHIELKGRKIERVALTLLDYGGIQDRRVISQLLTIVINANFNVGDSQYEDKFQKLREKCLKLLSQIIDLKKMGGWDQIPFFNCWFLSIPQLLVLLDSVGSNEDFKRELWSTRSITFSSLDFYYELASMRQ
jgi:hypothetical protein